LLRAEGFRDSVRDRARDLLLCVRIDTRQQHFRNDLLSRVTRMARSKPATSTLLEATAM
jgi:hypothetical protein